MPQDTKDKDTWPSSRGTYGDREHFRGYFALGPPKKSIDLAHFYMKNARGLLNTE